jgi:hypothetical protein
MTLRTIFTLTILFSFNKSLSQQKFEKLDYPNGIYEKKEDFLNRKPSRNEKLILEKTPITYEIDSIMSRCYFYTKTDKKIIKKAFAISYKGYLYFGIKSILKNKNKKDKSLSGDTRAFIIVLESEKKFLYTESVLINPLKYGASVGVSHGVGGIIGEKLGNLIEKPNSPYDKGIVWDFKNEEFNIFKNCEDYNDFIKEYSNDLLDCNNEQNILIRIRKNIKQIR